MKAVALTRYLPIDDPQSLLDVEIPVPQGLRPINAANLRQAHQVVESGRSIGKLVVAGWD